ncbi:hypothetical protein [Rhodococcus sp. IEGM 1379]|nr:hypothetical protein [Rhodococcus sp. IEGM 1379]MDI9915498.1 hypothetical protein [Rhodococcus sp. IEGM 1379]
MTEQFEFNVVLPTINELSVQLGNSAHEVQLLAFVYEAKIAKAV